MTLGFGSNDVTVRRVWVLGPNRLVANVAVAPNAALGATEVSIISGFQVISQPGAFTTLPARPSLPVVSAVVNADPSQPWIFPGSTVVVTGQNLVAPSSGTQVTLNDGPMQLVSVSPTQVTFVVPPGLTAGLATLRLNNGATSAFQFMVPIDSPPATIAGLTNQAGQSLLGNSVGLGDTIYILVTGIDPGILSNPNRVTVTILGAAVPVQQIAPAPNGAVIQATVNQSFSGATVPLMIWVDGTGSLPVSITVK